MRPRTATAIAVACTLVSAALMVVALTLAYFNGDLNVVTSAFGPDLVINLGILPVGLIVAIRQRDNPIGWLLVGCSVLGAIHALSGEYAIHGLLASPELPGTDWSAWLSGWIIDLVFPAGGFMFVLLLFPSGRLLSPRWRILAWTGVVFSALLVVITIPNDYPITVAPNLRSVANPIGVSGFVSSVLGSLWVIWPAGILVLLVAGVSIVVRHRRSAGEERQQIKWFAYAVGATLAAYAVTIPFGLSNATNSAVSNAVLEVGVGVAIPLAIAIAILRYKLYGIDIVISRTLVYGSLAALITGVYVGIAVGIGTLVGSGGKPNLGLSILATAIVAVGFQPARARLQRVANRLVYGTRATPYEVLSEFSGHVAETYAAADVLPRMARVLQEGTGATTATVWLRAGDQLSPAATYPSTADGLTPVSISGSQLPEISGADSAVPVFHQGDLLGALTITKRRGESLTPIELKLLDDLAHQAGLVLKNVGLSTELLRRLDELRSSRQRLVAAQDQERRRLERNLHDGAQQHLVAIKVKLGLAEMLMDRDAGRAVATLQQLKADADDALETLRDLARGIYPPILAERGLAAALQAQATRATLPVAVEADMIPRCPQALEAAVYFCVLEALQNVQKYSGASRATVRLSVVDGTLHFEVADDGVGFDPGVARGGSGLTNMADRLDALGGRLDVRSQPGAGCRVMGSLPVAADATVVAVGAGEGVAVG
ncbi:MAG TPA: histidine kinase [Candidatus Dormibacteraeota bacterium]|nr:histidine kinase [Candidatus Dormibacteraeota bacterium]